MSNSFRCKLLHTKQFGTQTVHDQLSQRRCAARSQLGPAGGRRQRPAHVTAATNSPTRKQVSHHVWHLNSVSEQSMCQTVCCQQFGAEPVRCQLFRQQTVCYKAFGIQPVHCQLFNQQTVCYKLPGGETVYFKLFGGHTVRTASTACRLQIKLVY